MINYKFSNLVGTVYNSGNILFADQQSSTDSDVKESLLLSPVGNKLTVFDLTNNISQTLPFQNRSNISRIELSPDKKILITIDVDGFALVINFLKRVVIAHFNFKAKVTAFAFSPDSRFFAVATGKKMKIFESPSVTHKMFSPMILYKKYGNLHSDDIKGVTWSTDSRFFLTWSDDLTLKMMSLHKVQGFLPFTFGGNKQKIVRAFFSENNSRIFSIAQNGTILLWKWTETKSEGAQKVMEFEEFKMGKRLKTGSKPNEYVPVDSDRQYYTDLERSVTSGRFLLEKKTKLNLQGGSKVVSCDYSAGATNKILVLGQSNGVFALFNMDTMESIHSFQISDNKIDSVSINEDGEWIALASRQLGQLFVWEWKSETYVLKQQGHYFDLNALAYSPDGQYLATGGDDGKLKLWTTKNCLCFVTFSEHKSQITDIKFIPKKGNAVLSSSLDGTVRAFDLVKYRNFRVLLPNKPTQFNCLAIDSGSGDIVCAGSMDPFDIFVWSLRTGQLMEALSGHTAPVVSLAFSPNGDGILASGSWDQTMRVWDLFDKKGIVDTHSHSSEVVAVEFHPNNKDVVSTTLTGQVHVWEAIDGNLIGIIECKNDIHGGRMKYDRVMAKNSTKNKHFNSISISPNGDYLIGGGNSKNICLYDVRHKLLLRRFAVTQNRSLDGVLYKLNSKNIKGELGEELDIDSDLEEDAWQVRNQADAALPGAKKDAKTIKRNTKLAIRIKSVKFSPDGTSFACATTEGLLLYSLRPNDVFNPVEIDETVTLDNIIGQIKEEQYISALLLALKLNEFEVTEKVYKCIPIENVPLLCANIPSNFIMKFLEYLSREIEKGKDIEWNMVWLKSLLKYQEPVLRKFKESGAATKGRAILLKIYSSLSFYDQSIKKIANENNFMMKFMLRTAEQRNEEPTLISATDTS